MKHSYCFLIATLFLTLGTAHGAEAASGATSQPVTGRQIELFGWVNEQRELTLYAEGKYLKKRTVPLDASVRVPYQEPPITLRSAFNHIITHEPNNFFRVQFETNGNIRVLTPTEEADNVYRLNFYPILRDLSQNSESNRSGHAEQQHFVSGPHHHMPYHPGMATMPVQNPYAMGGYSPNFVQPHMPGYQIATGMMHPSAQHYHPGMAHAAGIQLQQQVNVEALVAEAVAKTRAEMLAQQNGIIEQATRAAVEAVLERLLPQQQLPMSPSASVSPQPAPTTPHNLTFSPTEQFDLPADEPVARTITSPPVDSQKQAAVARAATPQEVSKTTTTQHPHVIYEPKPGVPVTPPPPTPQGTSDQEAAAKKAQQKPTAAAAAANVPSPVTQPAAQTSASQPQAATAQVLPTPSARITWAARLQPTAAHAGNSATKAATQPQQASRMQPSATAFAAPLQHIAATSNKGRRNRNKKSNNTPTDLENALNFVEDPDTSLPEAEQLRLCRLVTKSQDKKITHEQKEAAGAIIVAIQSRQTLSTLPKDVLLLDEPKQSKPQTKAAPAPAPKPVAQVEAARAPSPVQPTVQSKKDRKDQAARLQKHQERERQQKAAEEEQILAAFNRTGTVTTVTTVTKEVIAKHLNSSTPEIRAAALRLHYDNKGPLSVEDVKYLSAVAKSPEDPKVKIQACILIATQDRNKKNAEKFARQGYYELKEDSCGVRYAEFLVAENTTETNREACKVLTAILQNGTLQKTNPTLHALAQHIKDRLEQPKTVQLTPQQRQEAATAALKTLAQQKKIIVQKTGPTGGHTKQAQALLTNNPFAAKIAQGDYEDVLQISFKNPAHAMNVYSDALTIPGALKDPKTRIKVAQSLYVLTNQHPKLDPYGTLATQALRVLGECKAVIPEIPANSPSTPLTPHIHRLLQQSVLEYTSKLTPPPANGDMKAIRDYQTNLQKALKFFDGIPHTAVVWGNEHLPKDVHSVWQHFVVRAIKASLERPNCTVFDFAQCAKALALLNQQAPAHNVNTAGAQKALEEAKARLFGQGLPCAMHIRQTLRDALPEIFTSVDDKFNAVLSLPSKDRRIALQDFCERHPDYEAAKIETILNMIHEQHEKALAIFLEQYPAIHYAELSSMLKMAGTDCLKALHEFCLKYGYEFKTFLPNVTEFRNSSFCDQALKLCTPLEKSENPFIRDTAQKICFKVRSQELENLPPLQQNAYALRLWQEYGNNPVFETYLTRMGFTNTGERSVCESRDLTALAEKYPHNAEILHFISQKGPNNLDQLLNALNEDYSQTPELLPVLIEDIYRLLLKHNPTLASKFIEHYIHLCPQLATLPIAEAIKDKQCELLAPLTATRPTLPPCYVTACEKMLNTHLERMVNNIEQLPYPVAQREAACLLNTFALFQIAPGAEPLNEWLNALATPPGLSDVEAIAQALTDPSRFDITLGEKLKKMANLDKRAKEKECTEFFNLVAAAVALNPENTETYLPQLLQLCRTLRPSDHPAVTTLARTIASSPHALSMKEIPLNKGTLALLGNEHPLNRALGLAALQQLIQVTVAHHNGGNATILQEAIASLKSVLTAIEKLPRDQFPDVHAVGDQIKGHLAKIAPENSVPRELVPLLQELINYTESQNTDFKSLLETIIAQHPTVVATCTHPNLLKALQGSFEYQIKSRGITSEALLQMLKSCEYDTTNEDQRKTHFCLLAALLAALHSLDPQANQTIIQELTALIQQEPSIKGNQ